MKYASMIPAALVLALGAGGYAIAQPATTNTTTTGTPTTPQNTQVAPMGTATAPTAMAPTTTTGAPIVSGTASATNGAVNTEAGNNAGAPVAGANSFTKSEARRRIQGRGFKQVSDLKLDRQGIWRGKAMRNGHSTAVSLDYQGNVVPH